MRATLVNAERVLLSRTGCYRNAPHQHATTPRCVIGESAKLLRDDTVDTVGERTQIGTLSISLSDWRWAALGPLRVARDFVAV